MSWWGSLEVKYFFHTWSEHTLSTNTLSWMDLFFRKCTTTSELLLISSMNINEFRWSLGVSYIHNCIWSYFYTKVDPSFASEWSILNHDTFSKLPGVGFPQVNYLCWGSGHGASKTLHAAQQKWSMGESWEGSRCPGNQYHQYNILHLVTVAGNIIIYI